jgi:lysophospholipase L1-like esterase
MGRVLREPDAVRFAWSGTSASVRFVGPKLSVDLEDSGQNAFYLLVDGVVREPKLVPGRGQTTLVLADGLAEVERELTLVRLTEAMLGETAIFGFHAPGGELLPYRSRARRRIELIGDSISAGYGNEAAGPECSFSALDENHYLSYGAIAARTLAAELVTVAWSGKGVFRNAGHVEDTLTMPKLWRRTLPGRVDSAWDFARFVPDAVVVNLGTNDFSPNNRDQAPFAEAYARFIAELRSTYPDALLLCTNGPLLSDVVPEGSHSLSRARAAIEDAVEGRVRAGDARVAYLEFPEVSAREGYGADYHPSLLTHRRMAEQLTRALREHLGW